MLLREKAAPGRWKERGARTAWAFYEPLRRPDVFFSRREKPPDDRYTINRRESRDFLLKRRRFFSVTVYFTGSDASGELHIPLAALLSKRILPQNCNCSLSSLLGVRSEKRSALFIRSNQQQLRASFKLLSRAKLFYNNSKKGLQTNTAGVLVFILLFFEKRAFDY